MTLALTMQLPPTAEELELKQRVAEALASQGVLGKIKAQLRAAVFHVIHEREQDDELLVTNNKLQEFKHDGALALAIVMDFLAFFQLEHSLAVLRTEANAEKSAGQEVEYQQQLNKLCERLGLSEQHYKRDYGSKQHQHERLPLLIQILLQQPQQPPEFSETSKDRMSRDGRLGEDGTKYTQKQKQDQFPSDFNSPSRHRADEFGRKNVALGEKHNTERVPTIAPTATAGNSSKCVDERANESGSDEEEEEQEAYKNATNSGNTKDKLNASLAKQDEDDDEDEDEVVSGSELSESIAEEQSASLNYSQDYDSASKDESADFNEKNAKRGITAGGGANGFEASVRGAGVREEEEEHEDSGDNKDGDSRKEDEKAEESDEEAAPPPVSTTLSPSLPPIAASASSSNITSSRRGTLLDDDEFDEELEAARLSSLDAKLKAMEAEDETGTLQQLKASLQMELQQDDEALKKTSSGAGGKSADGGDDDDDAEEHDGYGSDFEEEEVTSEVSDDEVGSVSDLLSDNDESQSQGLSTLKQQEPRPQPQPEAVQTLHEDRPVEDENALNSYDYIEVVETDW